MCSRFILSALFFSLALGPQVMFLHAQGPEETPASTPLYDGTVMNTESPAESRVTSPHPNLVSSAESTAYPTTDFITVTDSTTAPSQLTSTPETAPVTTTHTEEYSTSTELPQVLTTVAPEVTTAQPRWTTAPPDPQTTTERPDTTVDDMVTTVAEDPFPVATSAPRTAGTTASEATTILTTHNEETMETTHSTMATNPIPILHTWDEEEDLSTEDYPTKGTEISTKTTVVTKDTTATVNETSNSIELSGTGVKHSEDSSSKWLLIIIIAAVAICMLMGFCIIVFIKRRKKSGQQNFGHMNGRNQRSKKKKGENDAWAGPVNLEGGQNADCEDPAEAGHGDNGNPDGTDEVLTTFAALEVNGGVGRPGSMEVQKWEEQEPLLFIDEDLKGEGKDKQKEGAEKAKEQKGEEEDASKNMETKEPELNGGETFCLTTAV